MGSLVVDQACESSLPDPTVYDLYLNLKYINIVEYLFK